jgi:hypothetical protein
MTKEIPVEVIQIVGVPFDRAAVQVRYFDLTEPGQDLGQGGLIGHVCAFLGDGQHGCSEIRGEILIVCFTAGPYTVV